MAKRIARKSYRIEVLANGEWQTEALSFATEIDAEFAAAEMLNRADANNETLTYRIA